MWPTHMSHICFKPRTDALWYRIYEMPMTTPPYALLVQRDYLTETYAMAEWLRLVNEERGFA